MQQGWIICRYTIHCETMVREWRVVFLDFFPKAIPLLSLVIMIYKVMVCNVKYRIFDSVLQDPRYIRHLIY